MLYDSSILTFLFQLVFTWIARCLMQLNSCVNPFIYAAILPEVKTLAKDRFTTTKTNTGGQTTIENSQFELSKRNNKSTKPITDSGKDSMSGAGL